MSLSFYNTMTRTVEEFRPMESGHVRMYTCGPTVYDYAHIGNLRTYAFEDLLRRWLKYRGYQVTQVMNITDVEDKIIKKHRESGKPVREITEPYIRAFHEDMDTLNVERAEQYPRATAFIPQMLAIIRALLEKGYAYPSDDGSIYYSIRKFPGYGRLAHFRTDELVVGARVKQDEYDKETASDFALWKAWDPNDGEVWWESDYGRGRPGWHLECSAMSMYFLGQHFDIHTGGEDNIFPHHENEIAQSEAATGEPFVNYWLHSRHLLVDEGKMSKSKGNFWTLRQLVREKEWPWYALRYLYVSSHYRSLLNFTMDGLTMARNTVEKVYDFLRRVRDLRGTEGAAVPEIAVAVAEARSQFEEAMDDDLNSPRALAALHTLIGRCNRWMAEAALRGPDADAVVRLFLDLDAVLGLKLCEPVDETSLDASVEALVQERQDARKRKDFARADAIRAQLHEEGILLEDTPAGVRWKRA